MTFGQLVKRVAVSFFRAFLRLVSMFYLFLISFMSINTNFVSYCTSEFCVTKTFKILQIVMLVNELTLSRENVFTYIYANTNDSYQPENLFIFSS